MLQRLRNWWNRKALAAEAFKKRQLLVVERTRKELAQERARLDSLRYSPQEVEAFITQHRLTGRPILLDLALLLERRLTEVAFEGKHEMYRLRLEQILEAIDDNKTDSA